MTTRQILVLLGAAGVALLFVALVVGGAVFVLTLEPTSSRAAGLSPVTEAPATASAPPAAKGRSPLTAAPAWQEPLSPEQIARLARDLRPAALRVRLWVRFDKGEPPRRHGYDIAEHVRQERPVELPGYLVSARQAITRELAIHPRFLERISVLHEDAEVEATVAARATSRGATRLRLAEALPLGGPLRFAAEQPEPWFLLSYGRQEATWGITATPFYPGAPYLRLDAGGRVDFPVHQEGVVVGPTGMPWGLLLGESAELAGDWRGSPTQWEWLTEEDLAGLHEELADLAARTVVRVSLRFRSPRRDSAGTGYNPYSFNVRSYGGSEEASGTERSLAGVLLPGQRLLVPALLKPQETARLEQIRVWRPDGDSVEAFFAHTLRDYGAFLAHVPATEKTPLLMARGDIRRFQDELLMGAEVRVRGEQRLAYLQPYRLAGFQRLWNNRVYPYVRGDDEALYLFSRRGDLVALPLIRRERIGAEDRWDAGSPTLTPAAFLAPILADPAAHADPDNVPLAEAEENRLAWLGVELQPLTQELARALNVSDRTRDGEIGAMVSYVYPGSPAAEGGLEPGMLLLRLHVEDQPQPLEVRVENLDRGTLPWEDLDQVSELYYERLQPPWPPAENAFTRALTGLGFGTPYEAEIVDGEQVIRRAFTVRRRPPHYAAAARHKSEALGLTVRNLTVEVRRYFQLAPEAPGVIVSRIEPGGKASVAGLKPFEIVLQVNGTPVPDVEAFAAAVGDATELRLQVKRMARTRIVKIRHRGLPAAPEPAP